MINSTQVENNNSYSIIYELEELKNGGSIEINNNKIIDKNIADKIARAEFLENGYTNQVAEFTTDFTDLKINDIISIYAPSYRIPKELNKDKFIIKRIEYIFTSDSIESKIKAVRYDL